METTFMKSAIALIVMFIIFGMLPFIIASRSQHHDKHDKHDGATGHPGEPTHHAKS